MGSGTQQRAGGDRAQVLALGPDTASRQAALSLPARAWSDLGSRGPRVWGRCRGSRAEPYEVVVDRDLPAYACSCPSGKVPCKHALALLLRASDGDVPEAEPPEFVGRRLDARAAAAATRAARPAGELADPAAAAARAATRAARVATGLDELALWLGDQVRGGLAGWERAGYTVVETVAARMVDAQAPGVAGLLRAVPGELASEGWPGRVLEQLAALHLLVEAHRALDRLPPGLAATVRSRVGYPVSRSEVLAGPGVEDDWLAVGQVDTLEARLETRRVWLWGRRTGRWALWLTFCPPGGAPDTTVTLGSRFGGSLHFYPGSGQYRAVLGTGRGEAGPVASPEPETLTEARRRFAALLAEDPWATRMPALLLVGPVPPAGGAGWRVRDVDGRCLDVVGADPEPWPLVAHARGRVVPVVVEWSSAGVRPVAVLRDEDAGPRVLQAV